MFGEILDYNFSQRANTSFKLPTMVGENLQFYFSQRATIAFKLLTMVGENLECYFFQRTIYSNYPPWRKYAILLPSKG